MKIVLPLTFLLLTCTAGETLFAQAAHSELQPIAFSTLDTNKDGKISPSEARADPGLYEAFAMLDVNHDGYLTPAEFQTWSRASKTTGAVRDPATTPSGSAGAQHMPPQ
jgi:Ca2+-binding EF-hand superfamily protein